MSSDASQLACTETHVSRIARISDTIRATFASFGIEMEVTEVKVSPDNLCFLLCPLVPVRMKTVRSFEDDLRFSLACDSVEVLAPVPDARLVAVFVYMNVSRDIFNIKEPEGILSPWTNVDDALYEEARELVVHYRNSSTAFIQRKLNVGYTRAARLIDLLEERGIVGPKQTDGHRDIYSDSSDSDEPPRQSN